MAAPVVIVGSGLAGWTVARELRKLDAAVPIVLVTASPGHFYAKPTLSNALALARTPAQIVTTPAEQMATASGVTLLAETTVTGIDAVAHTLSLSDGQTLAYRDLVLANGAQPIVLPMAGNAAHHERFALSETLERLRDRVEVALAVVVGVARVVGERFDRHSEVSKVRVNLV